MQNSTHVSGRVSLVMDSKRPLAEGPIWDDIAQHLLYIDIVRGKILIYRPRDESHVEFHLRGMVGTIVPVKNACGALTDRVLAAMQRGICLVSIKDGKVLEWLGNPKEEQHKFGNRYNDGKCDPAGRLLCGTMDVFCEPGQGAVYSIEATAASTSQESGTRFRQVISSANIPNGIAWSKDGKTMFWTDTTSVPKRIDAWDYDASSGQMKNRRAAVYFTTDGFPDGFTIDSKDRLWVAKWGGSCIECYDPQLGADAPPLHSFQLPASQVTACAFGGPNLDQLYVTTARCGLSRQQQEEQPLAGGLFRIDFTGTDIRGVPASRYQIGLHI